MLKFCLQRLLFGAFTILVISLLAFIATELLPGDVATEILGRNATPSSLAALRETLGLNEPFWLRYGHWLGSVLSGRLGNSLANGLPIAPMVVQRLSNTCVLAAVTAVIAIPLALATGIFCAIKRDSWIDRTISASTTILISVPDYLLAYIFIIVFSRMLNLFPSLAEAEPDASLSERVYALSLPILTLVISVAPYMVRMTRATIVRLLAVPYVEMARLKGVPEWVVIVRHVLPNALGPLANVIAFVLGYLVVGIIIIEVVFVYPGIGELMMDAVAARDIPTIQICGIIFGATYVVLNTIADLASILSNRRLYSKEIRIGSAETR
jgi:peptide/nickel transport system permease protein